MGYSMPPEILGYIYLHDYGFAWKWHDYK